MNKTAIYQSKLVTLQETLNLISSGDTILTAIYGNEPVHFLENLHTIADRVEDVTLWTALTQKDYPVMTDNSLKGRINIFSYFYNSNGRNGHNSGRFQLMPIDLHMAGITIQQAKRSNIFVAAVSPMDSEGMVYLSFDIQTAWEAIEVADTVIFEVNRSIPRVYGDTELSIELADYIYEADSPLPIAPVSPSSDTERQIAQYVASLIRDGDCIQLGLGGIPNAIGEYLLDKHDLGVHTEMISTSMGMLMTKGVITNARKNFCPGKTVGAFAWGDQQLYNYIADNPTIMLRRAAWVNNPFTIARNNNMVSVNTAIQIDLTGQICSESIGSRQYSGSGGALDFAYGAFHSKGGRGIMAVLSTAKEGTVSKIQPILSPGSFVSVPRNTADYVVTEFGIAKLRGRTVRQRVEALIAISHPNFREDLRKQANQLMLW